MVAAALDVVTGAAVPSLIIRVGGTAANASVSDAAGAVACCGVLLRAMAVFAVGGLVAGGGVPPAETPGAGATGGLAAVCTGGGLTFLTVGAAATADALNAPLLLCVFGSTRCGTAAAHPAMPITANRQGRELTDRRSGKSLVFGMAAA